MWQNDQANGTSPSKPKNVAPAVMEEILPTFEGLWAEDLLQGLSQNNNVILNHLVRDISLKTKLAAPETVLTASFHLSVQWWSKCHANCAQRAQLGSWSALQICF